MKRDDKEVQANRAVVDMCGAAGVSPSEFLVDKLVVASMSNGKVLPSRLDMDADAYAVRVPLGVRDVYGLRCVFATVASLVAMGKRVHFLEKAEPKCVNGPSYLSFVRPACRLAVHSTYGEECRIDDLAALPLCMLQARDVLENLSAVVDASTGRVVVGDMGNGRVSAWSILMSASCNRAVRSNAGETMSVRSRRWLYSVTNARKVMEPDCGLSYAAAVCASDRDIVHATHCTTGESCITSFLRSVATVALVPNRFHCLQQMLTAPQFVSVCEGEIGDVEVTLYSSVKGVVHIAPGAMDGRGFLSVWTGPLSRMHEAGELLLYAACGDSFTHYGRGAEQPCVRCSSCDGTLVFSPELAYSWYGRREARDRGERLAALHVRKSLHALYSMDIIGAMRVAGIVGQRATDLFTRAVMEDEFRAEYISSLRALPPELRGSTAVTRAEWFDHSYTGGFRKQFMRWLAEYLDISSELTFGMDIDVSRMHARPMCGCMRVECGYPYVMARRCGYGSFPVQCDALPPDKRDAFIYTCKFNSDTLPELDGACDNRVWDKLRTVDTRCYGDVAFDVGWKCHDFVVGYDGKVKGCDPTTCVRKRCAADDAELQYRVVAKGDPPALFKEDYVHNCNGETRRRMTCSELVSYLRSVESVLWKCSLCDKGTKCQGRCAPG